MKWKKKLLPLLLTPALFFGTPSKAKAGERFDFSFKVKPRNFTRIYKFEIEKVSKDTYKICAIVKSRVATENIGCTYRKVQNANSQTTSSNNSNLYKQKKQEFKPPELPYCRIKRADWEGVVIDYWDKWGEKHTYRWGVNNPYWYGGTGASVELVYEYREQDDGTRNYEGLEECLIRAGKKVLTDSYYGGEGPLYIDEIDGYPFDKVVLYYTTR